MIKPRTRASRVAAARSGDGGAEHHQGLSQPDLAAVRAQGRDRLAGAGLGRGATPTGKGRKPELQDGLRQGEGLPPCARDAHRLARQRVGLLQVAMGEGGRGEPAQEQPDPVGKRQRSIVGEAGAVVLLVLAGLDILSGGRLRVGLGLGWSEDEFEAVGASRSERGRRADEFLALLRAAWGDDRVEFSGAYYRIPPSIIGAKPLQRPGPPIYLAAFAPAALRRVAAHADGWHPVSVPLDAMAQIFAGVRAMAVDAGRQAEDLALVVRANPHLTDRPIAGERPSFSGSLEQIGADIAATRALGAAELCLDLAFSPGITTLGSFLELMGRLHELATAAAAPA